MRQIAIGTTAILLYPYNARRRRWTLQFTPTGVIAGNTGKVYVGRGFTPVATDGDAAQGDVLTGGSNIEELKKYDNDVLPFKGDIWLIASAANQQCVADEQTDFDILPAGGPVK